MKNPKLIKEFDNLNDDQKEKTLNFIFYILFSRKIKYVTNQLGETNPYIKLSDLLR